MKTYKGIELFKAVGNYELKNGTKLKCVHSGLYRQGIEVAEDKQILIWSDDKKPISYTHFDDRDFEFKIIEEEPVSLKPFKDYLKDTSDLPQIDKDNRIIEYIHQLSLKVNYLLEEESDT